MKYCTKCGSQVSESDKFCSDCGMPTDQSSNSDTIKADLKVELVNTSTDKAFKAVNNSITEGKRVVKKGNKAVKKGTKFTIKLISALIIPVFFVALVIGGYMYSNYLEEEKAQELRVKNIQAFNVLCAAKKLEFEENISNEKEMCVYKNHKTSYYLDYDETWYVVKSNCSLSYTEVNAYQDWLIKGIACPKEWRNFYDE